MPKCSFLDRCASSFGEARGNFETLVSGLDDRRANWQPAPGKWSVAECIDHLNTSAREYFPRMERAIERGREKEILGHAPYGGRTLLGRIILWALEPKARRKVKAPKVFRPQQGTLDFDKVCEEFRAALAHFEKLAEEADGLDLGRLRLATPIVPWPRVSLAEAFEIHALHIPRHLAQARRVIETSGFPS